MMNLAAMAVKRGRIAASRGTFVKIPIFTDVSLAFFRALRYNIGVSCGRGAMDNIFDSDSKDCGFESRRPRHV